MGTLADNFYANGMPLSGPDVIKRIQQETDEIAVAFSYGKDSLATYLSVKDEFKRVVPFFREFVPGMQFIERRLAYYEDILGTHIVRVNHVNFFRMIRHALWQPPHRIPMIDAMNIPDVDYKQINQLVFADQGLPPDVFTAAGVRAADSPQRRATAKSRGAINWNERVFWPVWDLSHAEVGDMLRKHNIKLSPEYEWWGTSFDGLRRFFLKDIREHWPEDYDLILQYYPFADMEFRRYELKDEPYPESEVK